MAFRDNLKNKLSYSNMTIKELSARSGVSMRTIDNYLRENASMPSAENAVRIGRILGVSVEYLVTGAETRPGNTEPARFCPPLIHASGRIMARLSPKNQKLLLAIAKTLEQQEKDEAAETKSSVP